MFFIGIIGIDSKEKIIGDLKDFNCKSCGFNEGKVIKYYYYFHFFFIPIFKWKENYVAVCNQCHSLFSLSKEKGKSFEDGNKNISYWDLKPVEMHTVPQRCPHCGKTVEPDFKYCPYCGKTFGGEEE